jgi:3-oxoacyl-[acyl-carrier protein] reductase
MMHLWRHGLAHREGDLMDLDLRDKVFLIPGATAGLGLATADILLAEGARVVISSRTRHAVDKAATRLGRPDCTVGIAADNADPDTADRLVTAALTRFGRLDGVLVSGGPPTGPLSAITDQQWRSSFESVFLGALRLARTAAPVLPATGSIGFVLSLSVRSPWPDMSVSNGLRPGLAMAAKMLADELGPRGIRVNGLIVGAIATDVPAQREQAAEDPQHERARRIKEIPLRRYGRPDEFARAAAFILSPAASYITGSMITIDGGVLRTM